MKIRKLLGSVSLVMALTMLAGCGKGAGTGTAGGTDTNNKKGDLDHTIVTNYTGTDMSNNPKQAVDRKDTIVIGSEPFDGIFNPLFTQGLYDTYVCELMYCYLTYNDAEGNVIDGIAEVPEVSDDKLTYTYKIKENANWSDGTPVTAKDLKFSAQIVCDASYTGEYDFTNGTISIKGSKDYQAGKADDVSGLEVVDDKTLKVTLEEPNSSAIYELSNIIAIPESYYGKYYTHGDTSKMQETFTNPGPTSGAYQFVSYKPGEEVVLKENDKGYLGAPKIKNVVYKITSEDTRLSMLQSGDIDMDVVYLNQDNIETTESLGYLNYIMYPENGYRYINLNFRNPALQDKAVRQALAYGLNREKIISSVFGKYAKVVNVPQAEASWSYSAPENNYEFDPEKAKKLLDDAGWVPGADGIREKDGKRLSFHFLARSSNPLSNSILAVAPDNYKDIGIEFTSESLDFSSMLTKIKAHGTDWDLCCMGWSLTADPNAKPIFVTDGSQNDGKYSNAKVDELFDKIAKEFDRDKLKELYKELYKELNEDLPYVYMYQGNEFYVYNGRVKNLTITPSERYTQHLHEATLE